MTIKRIILLFVFMVLGFAYEMYNPFCLEKNIFSIKGLIIVICLQQKAQLIIAWNLTRR